MGERGRGLSAHGGSAASASGALGSSGAGPGEGDVDMDYDDNGNDDEDYEGNASDSEFLEEDLLICFRCLRWNLTAPFSRCNCDSWTECRRCSYIQHARYKDISLAGPS